MWLLGLDLRSKSGGALAYTCWLAKNLSDTEVFVGVHVLEADRLQQLLRYQHLEDAKRATSDAIVELLKEHDAEGVLTRWHVESGLKAEQVLENLAGDPGLRGIVIGRQAKRGQSRIVHLGRVARRLLRALPAPVTIVPPDLDVQRIGDGPVVLAVNPSVPAPGAVAYAQALARDCSRPLVLLHVILGRKQLADDMRGTTPAAQDYFATFRERKVRALDAWVVEHGLQGVEQQVREGLVLEELTAATSELRAPVIVCGSRRLSLGQRIFSSSVASDLAAVSRVPVAVVPDLGQGQQPGSS